MRLVVYNISYGMGHSGSLSERIGKAHRFLRTDNNHLHNIIDFIAELRPDIIGLIEVDTGSSRTRYVNQAAEIARSLNHYHQVSIKYNFNHIARNIPILRKQGNAVLTKKKIPEGNFHFFPVGMKQLIIEVDISGLSFFLVHLSIRGSVRKKQVEYLEKLANGDRLVVIAGDFNTFNGHHELERLKKKLGLRSPNSLHLPTYPSNRPKRQLDFILCSEEIKIKNFFIPEVTYSDHLPLVMDFELP